ncbi:DNA topoisomerase IB [Corticibacterium sp. UT-5YL-CI-8]|nr:DNA topoisomerase IB [Tianweitania sp. UT-5YL-CI-8]
MLDRVAKSPPKKFQEILPDACAVGDLNHSTDTEPGIRRLRSGRGFRYEAPGKKAVPEKDMARIRALVIPPAWTDVWICADEKGHIQATGRDERGRKQYRYHSMWTACRGETKFSSLVDFARTLSPLRERVEADMRKRGLGRDTVTATVVWLLDNMLIRIGNSAYARDNKSFGLTTLRNRHVKAEGNSIKFIFTGKSGKQWNVGIADRRIARIIRSVQELPGQQLFQYVDDEGVRRPVTSQDVNAYVREATGAAFTSKHFRTWGGTVYALDGLRRTELPETKTAAKRVLNAEIDKVASLLGNTRAVCRSCYIHPKVFESWLDNTLQEQIHASSSVRIVAPGLDDDERMTLKWLVAVTGN